MQYFTHTLKACGPFALALALSACGQDSLTASQSEEDSLESSQSIPEFEDGQFFEDPDPEQSTVVAEVSTPQAPNASTPNNIVQPTRPIVNSSPGQQTADGQPALDQPFADSTDSSAPNSTARAGQPTVTLIANTGGTLNSSGTQLQWSTENVDFCEASGAWQGELGRSGVRSLTHESAGDQTYRINCRGPQGSAVAMVTVAVESTSLAWQAPAQNTDGSELRDLAGYNLYYGTEPGSYNSVRAITDPGKTQFELPVEPGTYYMAMTAYDTTGNESELSNEIVRIIN